MERNLKVSLLPNWADVSDKNPDGPLTYVRSSSGLANPLQISYSLYKGGKIPNPSDEQLVELAKGLESVLGDCKLVSTSYGKCDFGKYGSAVFSSEGTPYTKSWYLSNGKDFIRATFICTTSPKDVEISEADKIVEMLTIA